MTLFILSLVLGQIWLLSGLLINALQLLIFLTVKPFNINIYRRINYYLTYSMWSQVVTMAEWLSGSKVNIFYPDVESEFYFDKEHTLCVANHKYELDWLWAWLAADKFHNLGNSKGIAKKSLRLMPIMGWCWYFCEFIFLARNWNEDQKIFGSSLDAFMEYSSPVLILLFCEGTRYTKEKFEASVEFAQSKGLPLLKHHLIPRSRGFVFALNHLAKDGTQSKLQSVYNIQIAFHEKNNGELMPNFATMLRGERLIGDVYIERIPLDTIDTSSDKAIEKFLFELYQKKDGLMDHYEKHGKFPGRMTQPKRRLAPLINWIFWFVTITSFIVWVMSHGMASSATVLVVLATGVISFFSMIRSTKVKRGSSYGKSPNASPKHQVAPVTTSNGHANKSSEEVLSVDSTKVKSNTASADQQPGMVQEVSESTQKD